MYQGINPEILSVRKIVLKYYNSLTESQKKILSMIREGTPYREIARKVGYRDFRAIGKEIEKISRKFLAPLMKEMGVSGKKKGASISHKEILENVLQILEEG